MPIGLKANSDGSGAIQVNGTDFLTVTSGGNTTFTQTANLPNTFGFKNRFINGGMRIDQRNNGASVSISTATNIYTLDRWRANASGGGVFSVQRSTVAPAGFNNSLSATVTTADSSLASGDFYHLRQSIEGFNFSDLGFGSASAQPVTLSFWVRNSLTGTFTVILRNEAGNRGYLATYTVNAANTWEQKSITIPGDTTGTWATDNTSAAIVSFSLGSGSTQTAGVWGTSSAEGATGMTQWISTNGATFQITGVQLEEGSTATSFDFRPYTTELQLCQRYYEQSTGTSSATRWTGNVTSANAYISSPVVFKVEKRAAPTIVLTSISATSFAATGTATSDTTGLTETRTANATAGGAQFASTWTASIEL
jgi:hypothetical protein